MRSVNPLYLIAFLGLLVLSLFSMQAKEHAAFDEAKVALQGAQENAREIVALKQSWGKQQQAFLNLQRLLNGAQLKASFQSTLKKDVMIIRSDAATAKAVNYLLGKLFNATYKIETLTLTRIDNEHLKVYIEVKK